VALLNLIYRDQLFPHHANACAFEPLLVNVGDKLACRIMVGLLALAYDHGFESELADAIEAPPDGGDLPDLGRLRERAKPHRFAIPDVAVVLTPLSAYDDLAAVSGAKCRHPFARELCMKTANSIDAARLELLVTDRRLPSIDVEELAEQSDKESLAGGTLPRSARRVRGGRARPPLHAILPKRVGRSTTCSRSFDLEAVPMVSKALLTPLAAGNSRLEKGANLLLFGPPARQDTSRGSHRLALVENGWRVLFIAHQRTRPASADRTPRTRSRKRDRQAR
jgi:hypothetical protein